MKEQNIEQLFNNGLSNFEADVNPNAWTNIEHGLRKSAGQFSKSPSANTGLSSYGGWLLAVVSASIMLAVYLDIRKSSSDIAAVLSSKLTIKENAIIAPNHGQLASSSSENNNISEAQKSTALVSEQKTARPNKENASHGIPLLANSGDERKKVSPTENTSPQLVDKHSASSPEPKSSVSEKSSAS